ncbi:BTAD domain-containing putative transcriptional regulator [Microbacterium sp.]|uniref:ATP-binding protein n=1 Tax=Microbacterium sp. TaxID=51671 RepID=UPI0033413108
MSAGVAVLGSVLLAGRQAGGAAMRALAAALVSAGGEPRSAAALADEIWGDAPPQNPRAALQTLVSRLRSAVGADLVTSTPTGYAVRAEETDLGRARALAGGAEAAAAPEALALCDEALALWRGEPGDDIGDAPAGEQLRREASVVRERLLRRRAECLALSGLPEEAAAAFATLSETHPFDEALQHGLMTSLAEGGRAAEAMSSFAVFRSRLEEALGTRPGRALTDLNACLLREQEERAVPRVRIGVLAAPNALIGRDEALRAAVTLLGTSRLVTLIGPGGLGKTRLAHAVATETDAPMAVFVPLAGVRSDADVPLAIAAALGIGEANTASGRFSDPRAWPDLRARTVAALADRETLIVLDNCEQVIDGVADWAADLLAVVPALRILATSRSPLLISAERLLPLEPLEIAEDETAPAVRLFLERARAVRPGVAIELDAVARLCAHLDGLPLAIELAAARARTLSVAQIEQRLQDRFALLTSGDRTAPARHRTLEAVISWSWDLLDDEARRALAVLSLLPGGFSGVSAAAILRIGSADEVLGRLADQSLLQVIESPLGVRFRMLETVREFGVARLADAGAEGETGAWHAVLDWVEAFTAEHGLRAANFPGALTADAHREIGAEHDNLVFVLRRLLAEGLDVQAVRLFAVLGQSWFIRGSFSELTGFGAPLLRAAARVHEDDLPVDIIVMATVVATVGCFMSDDPASIRGLSALRRRERAAGERMSPSWRALARVFSAPAGQDTVEDALATLRASDDPWARLTGELLLAHFSENLGLPEVAMESAKRAWELANGLDEIWAAALAADNAAEMAAQSDRPGDALVWLDRARTGYELYAAEDQLRQLDSVRGGVLLALGRQDDARELFMRLAQSADLSGDGLEMAGIGWFGVAEGHRLAGEWAEASDAYERAMSRFHTADQRRSPWYLLAMAGYVSARTADPITGALPVDRWARRLRGRALAGYRLRMRLETVDRPVLGTVLLGWSAWALGRPALTDRGIEAIALAEVLGVRQDLPSLRLAWHRERAERLVGAAPVAAARDAAGKLTPADRVIRGYAVLEGPGDA